MENILPLDKMTIEDKLAVMEQLWEDLCRNPESIPSPSWHGEILSAKAKRVQEGKAKFSGIDEAKNRIRKSIK
jgi:hypothetical protein